MIKQKVLTLLVLLMTAVSGAWAGAEPPLITIESTGDNASFKSGSKTFDNKVTVTFSGEVYNRNDYFGWYSDLERTLTVTAAAGYTITGVRFTNNSGFRFVSEAPFEAILVFDDGDPITKVNGTSLGTGGVTKIEVYGYANAPAPVAVTGVTLSPTTATLTVGETETLTATVAPGDATDKSVTWSSSNTSVATVSNSGVVTAKGAGTATITVTTTDGAKTATCTVTVAEPTVAVTGVTLAPTTATLIVGETTTLTPTVAPDGATDKSVTWSSSNTSVATVSNEGEVTAVAAGTATITVTTTDGAFTATCTVTATVAVTGVTLAPTTATLTLGETETVTLTATVLPGDATDKSVTWSSSNTSVATVSNEGVVTAVAAGEATITVTTTDGAKTATCTVTVAEPTYTVSLKEGTDDAAKWQGKAGTGEYQALPLTGLEAGTAVTVKYDGRKRVRSVKAVKKAVDPLTVPLTMEALTDGTIVVNIMHVTGARRMDFLDDYSEDIAGSRRYVSPGSSKRVPDGGGSSNIRVKYSVNGGEKTTIYETTTETTTIPVNAGDKVQFYGDATSTQFHGDEPKVTLMGTAQTKVYGNIMSLIDEDNYATLTTLPNGSIVNFGALFYMNENLTDASGLLLPATTLTAGCYYGMFGGCTSLTAAPELPATELAEQCYDMMFIGCTSLTTAPALPAETLASNCYNYMFYGCTSLTTAPVLPATELAEDCYSYMFNGCTSLTTAPALPATTLDSECYYGMFSGCTSLTTAPVLPATTLAEWCYANMFSGCTSLTTAPTLPATTLANSCYRNMFQGCTSLNNITCLATEGINENYSTNYWVDGVASTGTFTKASGSTWPEGANGIPSGWTVNEQ